jgi:hypothetical protein
LEYYYDELLSAEILLQIFRKWTVQKTNNLLLWNDWSSVL